jgi:hypothetical protein
MWGISRLDDKLLVSQEGLYCMEAVITDELRHLLFPNSITVNITYASQCQTALQQTSHNHPHLKQWPSADTKRCSAHFLKNSV